MRFFVLFFSLWVSALSVCAQGVDLPQPPSVAARSFLLLDMTANQILAAHEIDKQVEPASLTKLMTAYLVFDALRLNKISLRQTLPVSEKAWRLPGSKMFLDPKMKVSVDDLIKGLIVQSGNDASMVLAESIGGTEERFVQLMNEQARALGMRATVYQNPAGLPQAEHVTTARDLSVLAQRLMQDFPQHAHYFAIKKFHLEGTPTANESNRNVLLFRDASVDGLKTGYTQSAGFCIIATASRDFPNLGATHAKPGSKQASGARRLMAIVVGAENENARAFEAQKLLNWGYTAFEAVKLFEANQPVVEPVVWKGKSNTAVLGQPRAIVVAVPVGAAQKITSSVARPDPLIAPLNKGQQIGDLKIHVGERLLTEIPLLALDGVEEAGLLGRAFDVLRLWIR